MQNRKILFICTENSSRSLMAEGFAKNFAPEGTEVVSAGQSTGKEVHPLAIDAMKHFEIDIPKVKPRPVSAVEHERFDLVVTLCDEANKECPAFKGISAVVHWSVDDPATLSGTDTDKKAAFIECAKRIRGLVNDLFNHGYFSAFSQYKNNMDDILNSLSEGILAHDLDRKIFYFSEKAAQLTGFSPESVIGRDCHEIFPGGFCSDNCSFCEGYKAQEFQKTTYPISFNDNEGKRKECELSVVPLKNISGKIYGVAASLRDNSELNLLKFRNREQKSFRGIIGNDPQMIDVFQQIKDVADYNFPVHIFGETGTGKELVAAAIHNESQRRNKPFVPVNCGALPESLIESELFGHVRGAFSGAVKDKKGRFELAEGGTVFLDEIGELSKDMQVKLLRFLQEGTFEKVGGEKTISANVRVISATNRNLKKEVQNNKFREDVYYRLNVIPVGLPPLRNKKTDIPLLVDHFLTRIAEMHGGSIPDFSNEAVASLMEYSWPGNIRELENAVQYAIVRSRGKTIQPTHLPMEFSDFATDPSIKRGPSKKLNIEAVKEALEKTAGNKSKAAKLLGVGRATLYRFLDENGESLI